MAFVHPPRFRAAAEALVSASTRCSPADDDCGVDMAERAVVGAADDCLRALSQKLGDRHFFFGSHPSSLDALAFSHLAPILRVPWPGAAAVKLCVQKYPNLERYVSRILTTYFSKECAENARKAEEEEEEQEEQERGESTAGDGGGERRRRKKKTPAELSEERWSLAENVVSCAGALLLMGLYGYGIGLFHNLRGSLLKAK